MSHNEPRGCLELRLGLVSHNEIGPVLGRILILGRAPVSACERPEGRPYPGAGFDARRVTGLPGAVWGDRHGPGRPRPREGLARPWSQYENFRRLVCLRPILGYPVVSDSKHGPGGPRTMSQNRYFQSQDRKLARVALVHIENFAGMALSQAETRDTLDIGSPEFRDENDSCWDSLNSVKEWIDLGKDAVASQSGANWDPSLNETFNSLSRYEFEVRVSGGAYPEQEDLLNLRARARVALDDFEA